LLCAKIAWLGAISESNEVEFAFDP